MKYEVEVVCERMGEIIGRMKKARIGWVVYDLNKRKIGRIVDLFGPVSNPYVRIKTSKKPTGKIMVGGDAKWQRRRIIRNG